MKNLILVTNDDGIKSPGIIAAAQALRGLGEVVVVAPREQQSSAGRAFYWKSHQHARKYPFRAGDENLLAYALDASPAVAARYALHLIAQRRPALVVSGINYGENLGSGLTISGTVGAALEAAAFGVPALAVSLQTAAEYHTSYSTAVDFRAAAHFVRLFARQVLRNELPAGVQLLNINVPTHATTRTPWRVTRASAQSYFHSIVNKGRFVGYDVKVDVETLEPDSDIQALFVDHMVSVSPLALDLTARVKLTELEKALNAHPTRKSRD
ncbi:MAG: 5'/3'-nucleotidase SurE [Anaerolineae bacterium]